MPVRVTWKAIKTLDAQDTSSINDISISGVGSNTLGILMEGHLSEGVPKTVAEPEIDKKTTH